jgi:hypothetical protein
MRITRLGVICGIQAAALALTSIAVRLDQNYGDQHLGGFLNDFWDYWGAARILNSGGDPYDRHLLGQVLAASGLHSTVGTGYSYPVLLAELARPLGLLPPGPAAVAFTAGSLAALGLAVALLVSPIGGWKAVLVATAAGLFAPVDGTLYFGQVNLYLLPLLVLSYRGVQRPLLIALAAAVKLYPAALLVGFAREGRKGARLAITSIVVMAAVAVGPNLVAGRGSYAGNVLQMFGPDPYWSNQSINGWLSRVLHGGPVTPLMLITCTALGSVVAAILARRSHTWQDAFALLLCYSVVAAPKNSLWNFAPLIIALTHGWAMVGLRPPAMGALVLAWALLYGSYSASLPLLGGMVVLAVLAAALVARRPERSALRPRPSALEGDRAAPRAHVEGLPVGPHHQRP